ncbi:hypothetical protein EVAR_20781_1 [Eumeta japonica]|uniref:Uncharacterized protein n=1 Tax=Eumeta variegata TaxID=151549 RepID=A0A4C1UEB8_EUMVA|nr:hypothetical protein EVAR_20781_1 [Eumeta japonica]
MSFAAMISILATIMLWILTNFKAKDIDKKKPAKCSRRSSSLLYLPIGPHVAASPTRRVARDRRALFGRFVSFGCGWRAAATEPCAPTTSRTRTGGSYENSGWYEVKHERHDDAKVTSHHKANGLRLPDICRSFKRLEVGRGLEIKRQQQKRKILECLNTDPCFKNYR